ncbi:Flap endonuclease 1-like protein [Drosera capensis]
MPVLVLCFNERKRVKKNQRARAYLEGVEEREGGNPIDLKQAQNPHFLTHPLTSPISQHPSIHHQHGNQGFDEAVGGQRAEGDEGEQLRQLLQPRHRHRRQHEHLPIVVGRTGTEMLTNEAGDVTSHLQGMFSRTIRLLEAGIKPVYVFDGKPPDLKKQELAKRYTKRADASEGLKEALESGSKEDIEKFSKRTVKVTPQHNEDCKKLLRLMGVPVIEVYAVASEDMDSLTFGAPRFLRHLMDPSSKKIPVMEFEIEKILVGLELSMDQFIDLCILSGCDYCDSIRGIGGQTALKLIRQHGSIENILENINKERYQIPDDWPYQDARQLFKAPLVFPEDETPEIKWSSPDEEGLIKFLVTENGFNSDRVMKAIEKIKAAKGKTSQGRLESFFKPVPNKSSPIKRKESVNSSKEVSNKKAKASGRKKK